MFCASLPQQPGIRKYGHSWSRLQIEAFELHVPVQTNDGHKRVEQLSAWRQQDGRDIHHSDHLAPQNCGSGEQYQTVELGQQRMGLSVSRRRYQAQMEAQYCQPDET